MCKFSLDFTKTLRFISKNTMSKVILKYQVSMLTCPSVHPAYPNPFQNNENCESSMTTKD